MYEDLKISLQDSISPQRIDVFLNVLEALDRTGDTRHHFDLQTLIHRHDAFDPISFDLSVEALLHETLITAIGQFGIEVESDSLELLGDVLDAIQSLPECENTDALLGIIEATNDPEECLAELMAYITDREAEDYLLILVSVNVRLIERLQKELEALEESEEEIAMREELVLPIRQRLECYLGESTYIITEAIGKGLPLGLDEDILVTRFVEEISSLNPERAAEELVGVLLASSLKTDEVYPRARDLVQDFPTDDVYIADTVRALRTMMTERGLEHNG